MKEKLTLFQGAMEGRTLTNFESILAQNREKLCWALGRGWDK